MNKQPVKLIECPRDAMQGWPRFIPTNQKADYINALLKVGFDTIDFGSFVSPKAIPQMADTRDVLANLRLDGITTKLLAIIANERGVTSGKIYNIGNPRNNLSVRELAIRMLELAAEYPEYRDNAAKVRLVETTAADYYGKGYQDMQQRVPKIANTCADLDWRPEVTMDEALRRIFEAYRAHVADAGTLVD